MIWSEMKIFGLMKLLIQINTFVAIHFILSILSMLKFIIDNPLSIKNLIIVNDVLMKYFLF